MASDNVNRRNNSKGRNGKMDDRSHKSEGKLAAFYNSPTFQLMHVMCVVLDAIVIGWEAECLSRYTQCLLVVENFFGYFDYTVSLFLILVLALQMFVQGRKMLTDFIAIFEGIVVLVFCVFGTFIYGIILGPMNEEYEGLGYFLRMGRVCRIIVLIRATEDLRSFPYLNDLYLLVRGLRDSLQTLVASVIILSLVVFMAGVILTAYIGMHDTADWSAKSIEYKMASFCSVLGSMQALFRFVFHDDAGDILEPLSRDNTLAWFIFVIFILISVFLVMNLIMAAIVNQAMVFTQYDKEHRAKQLQTKKEHYTRKVIRYFNTIDLDGNAKLTFREFEKAFEHPEIKNEMLAVGIEWRELKELFFILDTSNTGELAVADFVTGMQRLRGQAASRDLLMTTQYVRSVFKHLMTVKAKRGQSTKAAGAVENDEAMQESAVRKNLKKLEIDVGDAITLAKELSRLLHNAPPTSAKRDSFAPARSRRTTIKRTFTGGDTERSRKDKHVTYSKGDAKGGRSSPRSHDKGPKAHPSGDRKSSARSRR